MSLQDQALAGFGAGLVSTGILHPLDVIKIRFQGTCHWDLETLSSRELVVEREQDTDYV